MVFSAEVRKELLGITPVNRHCAAAESAAMLAFSGVVNEEGDYSGIKTETEEVKRKVFTLLKKAFNIVLVFVPAIRHNCFQFECSPEELRTIAEGTKYNKKLVAKECCKKAYLRGAFEAAGTISNPDKYYRLEFVCREPENANNLFDILSEFSIEPRIAERDGDFVVYLQEAEAISTLLGIIGANNAVLEFENIRVVREVRGNIQRKVNCETSNLNKTVKAACRQIEDIEFIKEKKGLDYLPEQLIEVAELRQSNPEASLSELGVLLIPPIGRSGINKRLKKISAIADELRNNE